MDFLFIDEDLLQFVIDFLHIQEDKEHSESGNSRIHPGIWVVFHFENGEGEVGLHHRDTEDTRGRTEASV
jgi:hypothetical protein